MKNEPLVSIIIPTKNSEKTLETCLKSIENQIYKKLEVIVVDSYSKDKTLVIAKKFRAKILQTNWKLLGARYLGFKESNGDFILMLDSDQILEKTAVERALKKINDGYDMLCLEERTYYPTTWTQKLFEADRKLVNKLPKIHLDPLEGVLLARFYRRKNLEKICNNISILLFPIVVAHDHAIIYYEACKVSQKVGILLNAVWHIEPAKLIDLWKKNFRYGSSTYQLSKSGYYKDLLDKKVRFRKGALNDWKLAIQTYLLLILKGIPYQFGYFSVGLGYLVGNVRRYKKPGGKM